VGNQVNVVTLLYPFIRAGYYRSPTPQNCGYDAWLREFYVSQESVYYRSLVDAKLSYLHTSIRLLGRIIFRGAEGDLAAVMK